MLNGMLMGLVLSNLALLLAASPSTETTIIYEGTNLTLVVVNVVFRHGQRSPIEFYPNDPYGPGVWSQGIGQLTDEGKLQEYELGMFLRYKYNNFLGEYFNKNKTYVQCTQWKRTFDSANWTLSGMYPNETDNAWLNTIYNLPKGKDIWDPFNYVCSKYDELFSDVKAKSKYKNYITDNKDFLEYISEKAGYDCSPTDMMDKCYSFTDAVNIEILYNFTQPDWITGGLIARAEEISYQNFNFIFASSKKIIRLKGGPLLQQIVKNMKSNISPQQPVNLKRLFMYSTHDTTIFNLQKALGLHDEAVSPLAACLSLELWKDDQGQHYVQMWYRNDSTVAPYITSLPGCSNICPFDEFQRLLTDVLPGDIQKACRTRVPTVVYIFGCLLILVFVVVTIYCIKVAKVKKSAEYHELTEKP